VRILSSRLVGGGFEASTGFAALTTGTSAALGLAGCLTGGGSGASSEHPAARRTAMRKRLTVQKG